MSRDAPIGTSVAAKTTLYYDPQGRCEAAYVQVSDAVPVRKETPDPSYLVSVYYDDRGELVGVRISEPVPASVLSSVLRSIRRAPGTFERQLRDAGASVAAA